MFFQIWLVDLALDMLSDSVINTVMSHEHQGSLSHLPLNCLFNSLLFKLTK